MAGNALWQSESQGDTGNEKEERKDDIFEVKTLPRNVSELLGNDLRKTAAGQEPFEEGIQQRGETENATHVETTKRVQGDEPRGREWGNGRAC